MVQRATKEFQGPDWYISPGRWRGALRQLVEEVRLTMVRVAADPNVAPTVRGEWLSFLGTFDAWLRELDGSDQFWGSSYDEIQTWHERLIQWRTRLQAAGATLPASDIQALPEGQDPFEGATDGLGTVVVAGGVLLGGALLAHYFLRRRS